MTNNIDSRMVLKLNTQTLNALFPEGTEARVQLQQAVVAEFAKKTARNSLDDAATTYLNALSKQVANKDALEGLVKSLFERESHPWNRGKLRVKEGGDLATAISDAIKEGLDSKFRELIKQTVAEQIDDWKSKIGPSVEYAVRTNVEHITKAMIKEKVDAALTGIGLSVTPSTGR